MFTITRATMTFKRLIISIAVVTLLALFLYLSIASRLLQESPDNPRSPTAIPESGAPSETTESVAERSDNSHSTGHAADATPPQQANSRLIEIYGRILDRDGQPIENALISEERYFFNTRSDAQGNYKLLLDLPRHRYPTLQFLRHGFARKRIKIGKNQLQRLPLYQLDVQLDDQLDSVRLFGWVGDDIGIPLEAARVELTALESGTGENYSLTVFTDERGNFVLEGVTAGQVYRLSANLAPDYPIYQDDEFLVSPEPEQVNIVLQSLRFVDIDGMILNRESAPVPNFEIYAANVTTGVHTRKIVSDSSGFFTLADFPLGEVSLTTRGTEFYKITGLRLTDSEYRNLTLIIDRGEHYLSGWVNNEHGIAIERAMVTIERNYNDGPIEYLHYRSLATDDAGKFSFEKLGAGEYRLSVYAQGYRKQELTHRLANQYDEIRIQLIPGKP